MLYLGSGFFPWPERSLIRPMLPKKGCQGNNSVSSNPIQFIQLHTTSHTVLEVNSNYFSYVKPFPLEAFFMTIGGRFHQHVSKSVKIQSGCQYLFLLLGSAHIKATRKHMLMKSAPGCCQLLTSFTFTSSGRHDYLEAKMNPDVRICQGLEKIAIFKNNFFHLTFDWIFDEFNYNNF